MYVLCALGPSGAAPPVEVQRELPSAFLGLLGALAPRGAGDLAGLAGRGRDTNMALYVDGTADSRGRIVLLTQMTISAPRPSPDTDMTLDVDGAADSQGRIMF